MGVAVWPMVELEADDALASAARIARDDRGGREGLHLDARQGPRAVRRRRPRRAGRPQKQDDARRRRRARQVRRRAGVDSRLPRAGRRRRRRLSGHRRHRRRRCRAAAEPARADRVVPARGARRRAWSRHCCSSASRRLRSDAKLFHSVGGAALARPDAPPSRRGPSAPARRACSSAASRRPNASPDRWLSDGASEASRRRRMRGSGGRRSRPESAGYRPRDARRTRRRGRERSRPRSRGARCRG